MIIVVLVVFGVCLGSFVNALVWRLHEQAAEQGKKRPNQQRLRDLSISRGRSMCPHCQHELSTTDLIPVFSWLWLHGKCRYCQQPISAQYPIVELATGLIFIVSYVWWPKVFMADGIRYTVVAQFIIWLALLVGFMALTVYDLKWMLLPNRLVYPITALGILFAGLGATMAERPVTTLLNVAVAVLIGGGIFYVLFQLSAGKWIGGGDVKLGWLLGLLAGTPGRSLLLLFIAALAGSFVSLPLLLAGRLKRQAVIPFGPFLIMASIIVQLYGSSILNWYQRLVGV